jgi:hypothetical protein
MIKITIVVLALWAGVVSTAMAQSNRDTIPPFIGVSVIPSLSWRVVNVNKADGDFLHYNFNQTTLSSYEGSFGFSRIGLRVGLTANVDDNFIGKIQRYGGYLGLKGYWLKLQSGKIEGSVNWTGSLPPGFSNVHNFSNKYYSIDLLKTFKKKRYIDGKWEVDQMENQMGFYWGVGYASLALPVKLSTLTTPGGRENQRFGVPVYDTLLTGKYYTAGFGWDLLRQLCMVGGKYGFIPGMRPMKLAMYVATQDKIGFGTSTLTNHAKEMGEALNPGKIMVNTKSFSTLVHYSLSVGFRYIVVRKPAFLVIAAGYDLEGAAIVNFGGAADTDKDLGYDTNFFYVNHGVSVKVYLSWVGK